VSVGACPRCGTSRGSSYRLCPQCGFDFWADAGMTLCPRCRAPRGGAAPICPSCGFDYRTNAVAAPPPPIVQPTTSRKTLSMQGWPVRSVGLIVLVGLAISVGLLLWRNGGSSNVPPAGSVWFGSSFDAKSFEIRDRADSFTSGAPVALVAHLSETVPAGYAATIDIDGRSTPTTVAPSAGMDFYGVVIPSAFLTPGIHHVRVFDIGGNELASGSLTVG